MDDVATAEATESSAEVLDGSINVGDELDSELLKRLIADDPTIVDQIGWLQIIWGNGPEIELPL